MIGPVIGSPAEPTLEDSFLPALADVQPSWHLQQRQSSHKAVSTDPQQLLDAEAQTTDRVDTAVQATTGPYSTAVKAKTDAAALAEFLQRLAPTVLAELSANIDDAAGRNLRSIGIKGRSQEPPECLFTLSAFYDGSTASANDKINKHRLQVTGVSWSNTGQTLAASYGRYDVKGWANVPGAIATWNLARLGINTQANPDRLIQVDNSLMCCAFHPAEPALIAGGTYNGELVIWDLKKPDADAQVAKTDVLPDLRHREPITAISWQYSAQEARKHGTAAAYRLFTLGADGRLLVWLWTQLTNPVYGYELQWMAPGRDVQLLLGGSCMTFCPPASAHEEAALLLVGAEGGRLLRCQVNDMNEASLREFAAKLDAAAAGVGGSNKIELRSAVKDADYEPLASTVNALSACPHHRQLAIAAGGDGTLRVIDVLRAAPMLVLEPSAGGLLSAAWSPSRPLVVAAGSVNGRLYFYDLSAKQRLIQPVAQLQVASICSTGLQQQVRGGISSKTEGVTGVNVLAYNTAVPSTLAAAAGDQIKVFRLPGWLVESRVGEAKLLKRMLDSEDVLGLLKKQAIVAQ